jgi:hypothetical protein
VLSSPEKPLLLPVYAETMAQTSIAELTASAAPRQMFGDSRVLQFLDLFAVEDNVIEDLNPSSGDDRSSRYILLVVPGLKVPLALSPLVLVIALIDLGIGVRIIFLVIPNSRHFLLILAVRLDALHTFCFIKFAMRLQKGHCFLSQSFYSSVLI